MAASSCVTAAGRSEPELPEPSREASTARRRCSICNKVFANLRGKLCDGREEPFSGYLSLEDRGDRFPVSQNGYFYFAGQCSMGAMRKVFTAVPARRLARIA